MVVECRPALRLFTLCCLSVTLVYAQTVQNGQIYTNGLAIVNAPAIGTSLLPDSDLQLSIDVSGNGKLEEAAWSPGSGLGTSYDSLNVFLTSAERKANYTVSTGSGLLTQEPGSTIKHFNWPIPECISPGQYEVTLYESSHINATPYFSITALSLEIVNVNRTGPVCTSGLNNYQQDVQVSSPPSTNPWIGGNPPLPNNPSSSLRSSTAVPAVTTGLMFNSTGSGGQPNGPIVQPTLPPPDAPPQPAPSGLEPVALIVVSIQRIEFTTTIDGQPTVETSCSTSFNTIATVLADSPHSADNGGFLPINRGKSKHSIPELLFTVVLWNTVLFALAWVSL